MLAPVLGVLALAVLLSTWSAWRARAALRSRLQSQWGQPHDRQRDMDGIADFFRRRNGATSIDDRTWSDLLLDDVFAQLDRTESTVGQQLLYDRLRSASEPRALDAFESLVARAESDPDARERAQATLSRLRDPAGYYLHGLARPGALDRPAWHIVFPLWTTAVASTLACAALWPQLLLVAVLAFMINLVVRTATSRRVGGQTAWFRQVGPLLSAAGELTAFGTEATGTLTGSLTSDLHALRRLRAIARWVSRDPLTTPDILFAVLEYVNILLLLDANAFYFAARELRANGRQLLRVIEAVGEIDAAIAVASFRRGTEQWTHPVFAAPDQGATFVDLRHPLLDKPVPNSITLAPPFGVLITGSNMSGKSTFLRTVGVNAVLAQAINTCLAASYHAPVYHARSCIGREDDLLSGKSYYLVEVESVVELLRASERPRPHLFIFDELFRGTNAVERIAAAESVLRALISGGRANLVIAATHDGELVDLLAGDYAVYHLSDNLSPDGLVFDYHLTPGPATSRNAIELLRLNGAPDAVVNGALLRAADLDAQRRRVSHTH